MRATAARPFVLYPSSPSSCCFLPPRFLLFLTFLITYLFLAQYCRRHLSFADPTSIFFDPVKGHEQHYSLQRQHEADLFLSTLNITSAHDSSAAHPPRMCLGIPTVAREGEQYIRSTIGSLLAGLELRHRQEIHITILIANTFPHKHPIFHEPWIESAVDDVLFYDVNRNVTNLLTQWEKERAYTKKGLFDYSYTLQRCLETGAQWIAMLEDDTLAAEGWYPRTMDALDKADDQHQQSHQDWLYLRLFFTEEFLGWNIEEAPRYLLQSLVISAAVAGFLLLFRSFTPNRFIITDSFIMITALVYTPALILLYFAAGRITMQPLSPGVLEMPKFGCCAQGLVFPRNMAARVVSYLDSVGEGFVDQLLEEWANKEGFVRWSVVPSLLQHIGRHSSKGDDFGAKAKWGQSVAEKIWSFGFERLGSSAATAAAVWR